MLLEARTGTRAEAISGRDTLAAGNSRRGTITGVRSEGRPEIRSARDRAQSPPTSYLNRNFQAAGLRIVRFSCPRHNQHVTAANLSEILTANFCDTVYREHVNHLVSTLG